MTVRSQFFTTM